MKTKPEKVQHLSHYLDDQYPIYRILSSSLFGYFYYNQFSFSSFKFYIGRDLMRDFSFDSFKFRLNLVLGQVISSYLNYWMVFMNSHFTGFYKMGTLNWFMIDSSTSLWKDLGIAFKLKPHSYEKWAFLDIKTTTQVRMNFGKRRSSTMK